MPLSQGLCAKGSALVPRHSNKAAKACGREELKRKFSENIMVFNNNHNNNIINNNNNNNNNNGNSNDSSSCKKSNFNLHNSIGIAKKPATTTCFAKNVARKTTALSSAYLLGESLARYGSILEAFDMYALIAAEQLDGSIPLDRLNVLATCLVEHVRQLCCHTAAVTAAEQQHANNSTPLCSNAATAEIKLELPAVSTWQLPQKLNSNNKNFESQTISPRASNDDYDPLLCPLCRDILRHPVTTNCGHTYCRQCCQSINMCTICHIKFPRSTLDEFVADATKVASVSNMHAQALTNTTTCPVPIATASALDLHASSTAFINNNNNNNNIRIDNALFSTPTPTTTTPFMERNNYISNNNPFRFPTLSNATQQLHDVAAAPITVTTTTVASTTTTATTTMATSNAAVTVTAAANSITFRPDVLVRRLVEKWWGPDLQAKIINETANNCMQLNLLDNALKFCNDSLKISPTNFKSLLLRSEVLRKLNHFQSSLADCENALKSRYTSAKAHYVRALALNELGRFDEALYEDCLAIGLDKSTNLSSSELFQHDLTKILQKLLAQFSIGKGMGYERNYSSTSPYAILEETCLRRKQKALLAQTNNDNSSPFDDDFLTFDKQFDIFATDEDMLGGMDCKKRDAFMTIANDYELPLRRQTSRKHCRRKWMTSETDLMAASIPLGNTRCSAMFRGILERTHQEVKWLSERETAAENDLVKVAANLIDASDFDCVLCCRTFWKPVVTPCGHTYCWVCLDRCMYYSTACPLCKSPLIEPNINLNQGSSSPVPFILAKRPVTKFLEAAMKRFIPDSYEKRCRQEMHMEPSVPVFICTTAFPHVPCPLFVCEPRYRLMVRRAVESGEKQFGIVQPNNNKSRYFDIGTILDIRDCVLLGDGCSILSTIGCKRFKILARNEKDGYETAKVEFIYDETILHENAEFVSNMHASVLSKAIQWYESLNEALKQEILQSFGAMPSVEDNWESIADGPAWAWWIIALLPLSQQLKVDILATTSLEKRLRAIEKTLDYLSSNFRKTHASCDDVEMIEKQDENVANDMEEVEVVDHAQHRTLRCEHELTETCQNDECCQRTTNSVVTALSSSASATHAATNASQHSQQLML